jgi:hypothetical protein
MIKIAGKFKYRYMFSSTTFHVSTITGYGLKESDSIPDRDKNSLFCYHVQTGPALLSASCFMNTGGSLTEIKRAGAWGRPLFSI